jgi:outer membrane protein OmpA-like peptidoglycan-associated protein
MALTTASRDSAGPQTKTANAAPHVVSSPRQHQGAEAGMPLYLHSRLPVSQPHDPAEREAHRMAEGVMRMPAQSAPPPLTSARASRNAGSAGHALSPLVREYMEPRFGADFSGVRVHSGPQATQMNRALGAHAFTVGQDIYFGSPAATANMALTAHELAHVVQQGSGRYSTAIQREIAPQFTLDGMGVFDVATVLGGLPNLPITITFTPDVDAPYSNQIGLIQIVRLTDAAGANVEPQSLPAARGAALRTQAADGPGVNAGFFTDVLHNTEPARPGAGTDAPAGRLLPPQYPFGNDPAQPNPATPGLSRPFSSGGGGATIGYKRSDDPADIKAAQLTDGPGYAAVNPANPDIDFEFETVAKGEDTMTIYGALSWGFQIRGSVVTNEHASVSAGQSATFDAALERHRDFYVHEPVIFYFDFDSDVLNADEEAKIDTFIDYLTRNPDVQVTPAGFADRAGGRSQSNLDLSLRRAQAVSAALLARGVPAAQIRGSQRSGATERFTPDAVTDQDLDANRRGNRRVVLSFRRVRRRRGRAAP